MKVFGGCFNSAEYFRRELKKGSIDTGVAVFGFLLLSLLGMLVVVLAAMGISAENQTVKTVAIGYMWAVLFTFVYNVIKAAFECFSAERAELFEILKR